MTVTRQLTKSREFRQNYLCDFHLRDASAFRLYSIWFIFYGARHDDEPGTGQLRAVQHLHLQWRGQHRLVRQLYGATHPPCHEGQVCRQAFNPILHTAFLHWLWKEILQNISLVKNPVFCKPSSKFVVNQRIFKSNSNYLSLNHVCKIGLRQNTDHRNLLNVPILSCYFFGKLKSIEGYNQIDGMDSLELWPRSTFLIW